jgi:hypothetical protein
MGILFSGVYYLVKINRIILIYLWIIWIINIFKLVVLKYAIVDGIVGNDAIWEVIAYFRICGCGGENVG